MSEIIDNCYQSEKIDIPSRTQLRAEFDAPVTLPGTPRMYAVGVHIWQGPVRVCGGYFPAATVAEAQAEAEKFCLAHGVEVVKAESPLKEVIQNMSFLGLWFVVGLAWWIITP